MVVSYMRVSELIKRFTLIFTRAGLFACLAGRHVNFIFASRVLYFIHAEVVW